MLPLFSQNQFCKKLIGTVLSGLCLSSFAQTTPLATPTKTEYPGILQTFEKLIQIDTEKYTKRTDTLIKNGRTFNNATAVQQLDLEPDFLNSIILHSDPGYLKMASVDKCRFYEAILTDLLRSAEGKINNVLMTYVEKDVRQSAIMNKKDFLTKVVNQECPETQKMIPLFQVKTLEGTLKEINFDIPTGIDQCRNIHLSWVNNPKTPFLCQIYEYIKEAKAGGGNPKDLQQRQAVAKILDSKQTLLQKDYIENICKHLDDEQLFCEEFLNVSFWTKVAGGFQDKIYAEDICHQVVTKGKLSDQQYSTCLARLKKEQDLCLYPAGDNSGLRPQPDCNQLSTALNHSALMANYRDCPGNSDQMIATNMARILSHFGGGEALPASGVCSTLSGGLTFNFNQNFDNDEQWRLEACYQDKLLNREICKKTFIGQYGVLPESYTNVVAEILQKTRGADPSVKCQMLDSRQYNPLLLQYKSGCYIIYEKESCFISQCEHKILFNNRPIDFIKIKNRATMDYFPQNIRDERSSQHYLLTHDYKKKGKSLTTLSAVKSHFKNTKNGIIHGIGCAEDLLPNFFKAQGLNQCSPLPFIINGIVTEKDKTIFIVRTGADSVQAPRLISWSSVYSAVKGYQRMQPLKLWTMYALD